MPCKAILQRGYLTDVTYLTINSIAGLLVVSLASLLLIRLFWGSNGAFEAWYAAGRSGKLTRQFAYPFARHFARKKPCAISPEAR